MKLPVVNGTSSVVSLIVTGVVIIACLVGMVLLSVETKPIPEALPYVLLACVGFLVGTRVSPPDVTQQIADEVKQKQIAVQQSHKEPKEPRKIAL